MTKRERHLTIAFLSVLLLAALYLGSLHLWRWNKNLAQEARRLDRAQAERELLLSERELWNERALWMEKQPAFKNQLSAESDLIQAVEDGAAAAQLKIADRSLLEREEDAHRIQVGLALSLNGKLAGVIQCMYKLQQPGLFRSIRKIRIIPSEDDPSVVTCHLELVRWYQPPVDA